MLNGAPARDQALDVADHRPDERLLDVGHGASVIRLTPTSVVLADADGTDSVALADFTSARPDPFHDSEGEWLRHLGYANTDIVDMLARHVPDQVRAGSVHAIRLDRLGLLLRVESRESDHHVRLAYSESVTTAQQLSAELRSLTGYAFLSSSG